MSKRSELFNVRFQLKVYRVCVLTVKKGVNRSHKKGWGRGISASTGNMTVSEWFKKLFILDISKKKLRNLLGFL